MTEFRIVVELRQEQADKNSDTFQDHDGSDNESEGRPKLCSSDDEDDALSNSNPAAHPAAAASHESILLNFPNWLNLTPQFAALVKQNQKLYLMSRKFALMSLNFHSQKRKRAAQYTPNMMSAVLCTSLQGI